MICPKDLGEYGAERLIQLRDIDFTNIDPLAPTNVYGWLYDPSSCKPWSFEAIGGGFLQTLALDCLTGDLSISFGNTVNLNCLNLIATLHNDTVYVDIQYGNDGTGVRENENLPFQTISAALLAALPGDTLFMRPGLYDEQVNLRNNVDMHFMPNAVCTNTAPGIVPVITDNGVAVNVSIDGDLEIISSFLPILLSNAGSNVAIKLNRINSGGGNIQTNAILKLRAKNILAFSMGATGTGSINVICPSVFMNAFLGFFNFSSGTSSLVGAVNQVSAGGIGSMNINGNITFIAFVGGILNVSGTLGNAVVSGSGGNLTVHGTVLGGVSVETGSKASIYGDVTGTVQVLRGSILRGRGTITGFMTIDSSAGTNVIDREGDIIAPGIGVDAYVTGAGILDFTLNGNIVSGAECIKTVGSIAGSRIEVTGNLRPANGFRAFHGLASVVTGVGSYEFVHNDGEIEGNSATAMVEIDSTFGGVPQLILKKSRVLNAGAGNTIAFVDPPVSKYIIDGTTEFSGAANSITATAPIDIRLYSTCVSNVVHDGNTTLLINAAGYVVDPAVL